MHQLAKLWNNNVLASQIRWGLLTCAIPLALGCSSVEHTETAQADSAQVGATPGLSGQQRVQQAITLLGDGNAAQARAELQAYLSQRPGNRMATDLLQQIDLSPEEYFPAEYAQVQLAPGQTLSTLAQDYLGSLYQFYALARYNDIAVPRDIRVGQVIQIPLTLHARRHIAELEAAAEAVVKASPAAANKLPQRPRDTGFILSEALVSLLDSGQYDAAIALVGKADRPLDPASRRLAATAYLGSAAAMEAQNPDSAAQRLLLGGELLEADQQPDGAFEAYAAAVELNPDNAGARLAHDRLQIELADKYHREASRAFRAQELDLAIASWDQALAIDPGHANARVYRNQAIELKAKLSVLEE